MNVQMQATYQENSIKSEKYLGVNNSPKGPVTNAWDHHNFTVALISDSLFTILKVYPS